MAKHALVINPWVTDFKLYDEWMHPVGLYFLISLLHHNQWEYTFINCLQRESSSRSKRFSTGNFPHTVIEKPLLYSQIPRRYKRYGISKELFDTLISDSKPPDIIFVGSAMTYWFDGLVETIENIKKHFPKTPLVVGGTSATLIPDLVQKKFPDTFLFAGPLSETIKTIPLFNSLSLSQWSPSFIPVFTKKKHWHHGPILTSLGCPFRCSYCASSLLSPKYHPRDLNQVIEEVTHLYNSYGIADFAFYDDALLFHPEKQFLPFLEKINSTAPNIRLHTPNGLHIRWLNPKVLDAMKVFGIKTLRFGYESGSSKYSSDTYGKSTRQELIEKVTQSKKCGYNATEIGVYVMAGLPGQTVEEVMEEIEFVAAQKVLVKPVFISPVPKTPLFDHFVQSAPQILHNPLTHNDTYFITQLPGWGTNAVDEIKICAKERNNSLYPKM